jgi:O-antigen/teichoic acid export membrane protein
MASAVAAIPVTEFGHLLCRVAYPAFCKVNEDSIRLRGLFEGAFRYNALAVAPLGLGLAIFGELLASAFLGDKWQGLGVALRILAIAALARALSALVHEFLRATGRVKTVQTFTLARLTFLIALGIPALLWGGLTAMCALIAASNVTVLIAEMWTSARASGGSFRRLANLAAQPMFLAGLSIGSVYSALIALSPAPGHIATAMAVLFAGATYAGIVLLLNRDIVTEARKLFAPSS